MGPRPAPLAVPRVRWDPIAEAMVDWLSQT